MKHVKFEDWYYNGRKNKRRPMCTTTDDRDYAEYIWKAARKDLKKDISCLLSQDNKNNLTAWDYIDIFKSL